MRIRPDVDASAEVCYVTTPIVHCQPTADPPTLPVLPLVLVAAVLLAWILR